MVEAVEKLAELGTYGLTFHDNDLFPFEATDADRTRQIERLTKALSDTGMVVPMVTTNLFHDPVFKDGGCSTIDLLENGAHGGGPVYDGPRHFDYKPLRTENIDGVWESARANMELYLALREKSHAFRADPEVQEALDHARVAELSQPTLSEGESYYELLEDRTAFEDYDIDRARTQGYGFARIQRLAIEHLLGVR